MKITCPKCQGDGEVKLSPKLSAVLALVPRQPRYTSVSAVATALGIKNTAANNRLEKMRAMKLVDRTGVAAIGWFYFQPKSK